MREFDHFLSLREKSSMTEITTELLPPKINIQINDEEEANHYYNIGNAVWMSVYDPKIITTLVGDCLTQFSYKKYTDLKDMRIASVILRDTIRLFSRAHSNTDFYFQFTKNFGKFNDLLIQNPIGVDPRLLIDALDIYESQRLTYQFLPTSPQSFMNFVLNEKLFILNLLPNNDVSFKDLHNVRKKSRTLLNYFLLQTLDNKSDAFGIYTYLRHVNSVLGDALETTPNTGDSNLVKVPYVARDLLLNFYGRIAFS